jgi:hypothetical protein
MASDVKRQSTSAEDVSLLSRRYNRNVARHARLPRRNFLLFVSAPRLHQTTLQGRSRLAVCLGLTTAGLAHRAQETLACPKPTIQSVVVALLPAAVVRTRFGMRAASWVIDYLPAPFGANAEDAPGAIQTVEVGSNDAARMVEIRLVSLFLWRVRSSLAASVRTTSSPARSAFSWLVSHLTTTSFCLIDG